MISTTEYLEAPLERIARVSTLPSADALEAEDASRPLLGTTILISGASQGLGKLFAERLARAGANLIVTGRDLQRLQAVAHRLRACDVPVLPLAADLTQSGAMVAAVEEALSVFGAIDVLVNNAGFGGLGIAEEAG